MLSPQQAQELKKESRFVKMFEEHLDDYIVTHLNDDPIHFDVKDFLREYRKTMSHILYPEDNYNDIIRYVILPKYAFAHWKIKVLYRWSWFRKYPYIDSIHLRLGKRPHLIADFYNI